MPSQDAALNKPHPCAISPVDLCIKGLICHLSELENPDYLQLEELKTCYQPLPKNIKMTHLAFDVFVTVSFALDNIFFIFAFFFVIG